MTMNDEPRPLALLAEPPEGPRERDLIRLQDLAALIGQRADLDMLEAGKRLVHALLGRDQWNGLPPSRLALYRLRSQGPAMLEPEGLDMGDGERLQAPRRAALLHLSLRLVMGDQIADAPASRGTDDEPAGRFLAVHREEALRAFFGAAPTAPPPVLHQSDVVARLRAEDAQKAADVAARRAAKAAHDAQFITVAQLVDRMRECGDRFERRRVAFEVLRGNRTPLFCLLVTNRDAPPSAIKPEDIRWSELPASPVVSRYPSAAPHSRWSELPSKPFVNRQCYTLPAIPGEQPPADPLAAALMRLQPPVDPRDEGFSADALAIRHEDAARLFDLAEPASIAPDHAEDVREMVTAPSASPPAPADPVKESPADRDRRRLREFEELGGRVRVSGGVAVLEGRHGALQELADREKAAGRPRSDRSDIGKALRAEALRRHKG